MRPLVIVGAGAFARETAELVHGINTITPGWNLLGFLDDDQRLHGHVIDGRRVIGALSWLDHHRGVSAVVCVGAPSRNGHRRPTIETLSVDDDWFATLVHPTAVVAHSSSIGVGSVIGAGAVLTADVELGRHVVVMPGAVLSAGTRVGDRSVIGVGARVSSGVEVGDDVYLGAGCTVRQQMSVGDSSVVTLGSVVTTSVPPGQLWSGHPAGFIRQIVRPSEAII